MRVCPVSLSVRMILMRCFTEKAKKDKDRGVRLTNELNPGL